MIGAPALLAELARLADAGERIAAALEQIAARARPAPDARLAMLLGAIYQALGEAPFAASELARLADSPLSTRAALRRAIGGASAKAIGKALAQNAGALIDGMRLERIGEGRPARWRVCAFERQQRQSVFNPWRL